MQTHVRIHSHGSGGDLGGFRFLGKESSECRGAWKASPPPPPAALRQEGRGGRWGSSDVISEPLGRCASTWGMEMQECHRGEGEGERKPCKGWESRRIGPAGARYHTQQSDSLLVLVLGSPADPATLVLRFASSREGLC